MALRHVPEHGAGPSLLIALPIWGWPSWLPRRGAFDNGRSIMDAQATLQDLLKLAQREPTRDDEVVITGQDPVLPTNSLLGTAGGWQLPGAGVANRSPLATTVGSLWNAQAGVAGVNSEFYFPSDSIEEGWGRSFSKEPTLVDPSPAARGVGRGEYAGPYQSPPPVFSRRAREEAPRAQPCT
jgi:hypothetical protein